VTDLRHEDLSRLLSGDLPDDEAAALRHRIATEPAVARAWDELRALVAGLEHLPEEAPPAALDARVLGERPVPRRRWPYAVAAFAAVLLVSVGLAWLVPRPDPGRIVLVAGEQWVDGAVDVVAGDVPISVDGLSRIRVEPRGGVVREPPAEEGPMKIVGSALGGLALGAAVTVAVIDGTATVHQGGDEVVVRPGETRTFTGTTSTAPGAAVAPRPLTGTPAEQIAQLRAENAELKQKLQEAEFSGAIARGQVASTQGVPSEWPDPVPEGFGPAEFDSKLRAAVAKVPGLAVHDVDCSEYPCLALLTTTGDVSDLQPKLKDLGKDLTGTSDAGLWIAVSSAEDDETGATTTSIGLAMLPEDTREDPGIRTRTDYRGQSMLQGLEEDQKH
jgi:hypothetical protein